MQGKVSARRGQLRLIFVSVTRKLPMWTSKLSGTRLRPRFRKASEHAHPDHVGPGPHCLAVRPDEDVKRLGTDTVSEYEPAPPLPEDCVRLGYVDLPQRLQTETAQDLRAPEAHARLLHRTMCSHSLSHS